MAEMMAEARVVIIGGGAVGVSCLYHLAKAGWSDCLLLEKNELTAGSTWHAAGNVPTFSTNSALMRMQRYSADLYRDLGAAVDYPINYHVTGSLRLAHSDDRLREFHQVAAQGRQHGMALEVVDLETIHRLYPFLDLDDLKGALYDPIDGDIDPAQLTQALAKGARDLGARIIRFCAVTAARRQGASWVLSTPAGEVRADYVVNAAGYRAREVGQLFGRTVPMMVMAHQYLLFDEIPALAEWTRRHGHKLPLLRDVDHSYYLRQEKTGFNLGPYERAGRAHWATPDDPMPDDFSFELFPDDLDRLEWYLQDAMKRVPLLADAGLSKVINGPIPYTPDGNPLIGPMPGVPHAFEACVFTFGIAQAGGAGKALAEWIIQGRPAWDLWCCDPRRFAGTLDPDYCLAKGLEVYGHEYDIQYPRHVWPAGRNRKTSPLHDLLQQRGAQFAPDNGWERALWYAAAGDDQSPDAGRTFRRAGPWQRAVAAERRAIAERAGVADLPGQSRFIVEGETARLWLDHVTATALPAVGAQALACFADSEGRVVSEMTVLALTPSRFLLLSAPAARDHDRDWLIAHAPTDGTLTISDVTDEFTGLTVIGPAAPAVIQALMAAALPSPGGHAAVTIAGAACRLVAQDSPDLPGFDLHCRPADLPVVFAALERAGEPYGLTLIGLFALDLLRLERGQPAWKIELTADLTLLEVGRGRLIAWDKGDFLGKAALTAERQRGPARALVSLQIKSETFSIPAGATLCHQGEIVGAVTSAADGDHLDQSLALAVVRADLAMPGTVLTLDLFGTDHPARCRDLRQKVTSHD